MQIHWIAAGADPSATSEATTVRLEAGLSGPFASVAELKAASGAPTINAPKVVATTARDSAPVSVIRIPLEAQPGFYNLTTTVSYTGIRSSGGSVITVEAS